MLSRLLVLAVRLFVTGHGLVGTCAAEMQKDDYVYVRAGGNLAYIATSALRTEATHL